METLILSHPIVPVLVLFICILLALYQFVLQTFLKSFELQFFSNLHSSPGLPIWMSSTDIPDIVPAEFIEGLRLDHYKFSWETNNRIDCAVCLLELKEEEDITVLKCKHMFHRNCLHRWLVHRHFTCPLCRSCLLPEKMASKQQSLLEQHEDGLVFRVPSFYGSSLDATWRLE